MSRLIVPTPWTSQPQYPVGSNARLGVAFSVNLYEPVVAPVFTARTFKTDQFGRALASGTAGTTAQLTTPTNLPPQFTLVYVGTPQSTPGLSIVVEQSANPNTNFASSPFVIWQSSDENAGTDTTKWALGIYGPASTTYGFNSIPAPATGKPFALVVQYDYTVSGSGGVVAAWVNGVKQTLARSSSLNTRGTSSTGPLVSDTYLHARGGTSLASDVNTHAVGLLGVVTDNVAQRLSLNPWEIFQPASRKILVATGATTHASSGALTADSAIISGTAAHIALHPSSGALTAQSATIAGTATHIGIHASSGALTAGSAIIDGTATETPRNGLHPSSGALTADNAVIAGTAAHIALHPSNGALTADNAVISGTAAHVSIHTSSGALVAQNASVSGSAINGNADGHDGGWRKEKSKPVKSKLKEQNQARRQAILDAIYGIQEPETPEEIKEQVQEIIAPVMDKGEIDAIALDLNKVTELLKLWQQEIERREDEEESILLLL